MKIGIIGAGRMGRRHVQAAAQAGLTVAGISDISEASLAEAVREGVPGDVCFTDTLAMLRQTRPEVVIVSTTAPSHAELVAMAVDHGARFVLCEKPAAVSIAQTRDMIEYCASRSVRLGVNHQMRYMEQYIQCKKLAESEELGGLKSITAVSGNMGMAMNATHYVELFRFLTGSAPAQVQAWFDDIEVPNPRGPEFTDKSGQIRAVNAEGRRLYMDLGGDQGHGLTLLLACRYGQIALDELDGILTVSHRKAEHRDMPTTRYGMPWERYDRQLPEPDIIGPTSDLLRALIGGEGWPDGDCALMTVRTLVAAHVSSENNSESVSVQGALPEDRIFPWA